MPLHTAYRPRMDDHGLLGGRLRGSLLHPGNPRRVLRRVSLPLLIHLRPRLLPQDQGGPHGGPTWRHSHWPQPAGIHRDHRSRVLGARLQPEGHADASQRQVLQGAMPRAWIGGAQVHAESALPKPSGVTRLHRPDHSWRYCLRGQQTGCFLQQPGQSPLDGSQTHSGVLVPQPASPARLRHQVPRVRSR